MPAEPQREKLFALQYIRAIAALVVVVFHICKNPALGVAASPWLIQSLQVGADAAVDIFFMLSGFIMVYTQSAARRSAAGFAGQRIARIVPLYWLATVGYIAFLVVASGAPADMLAEFNSIKHFGALSMLFASHSFGYNYPVLVPGWSLEYEMLFYAILAGAIFASPRRYVAVAIAVLAGAVALGWLRPLCLEFGAGMLVAVIRQRGGMRALARAMALIGPAVAALGFIGGHYANIEGDAVRLLYCGVPMLAVFSGALCVSPRRHPVLLALGEWSYAIYVSHVAWLVVFARMLLPMLPKAGGQPLLLVTSLVWCVGGGIALHYLVEKRVDALLRRRSAGRTATNPQLAAA